MTTDACEHFLAAEDRLCGSTDDVRLYGTGLRCPAHTPARLAGRPENAPDPARTAEGLRASAEARGFGRARTDGPTRAYPKEVRLGSRALTPPASRLWNVLQDGVWRTLDDLARASENDPDDVRSWLKSFGEPLYGGQPVEWRRAQGTEQSAEKVWEFRLDR